MKRDLTEAKALAKLKRLKSFYQAFVKQNFEHRARDCRVCPTPGVCCTDAHFVNVHITRLEAVAIRRTLESTPRLTVLERRDVYERARSAVAQYGLTTSRESFRQTYSCPLFDRSRGCLVHQRAKPAPCIQHACYDNWQDLPPDGLQRRTEHRVEQLNESVYGDDWTWLPIPVWLSQLDVESGDTLRDETEAPRADDSPQLPHHQVR